MDQLGAGCAENACFSADEPGSEDKAGARAFSVTVIVHDGSSARQTPEGHRISLDVRLGCCLVCERGKVATGKVLFLSSGSMWHKLSIDVAQSTRASGVTGLVQVATRTNAGSNFSLSFDVFEMRRRLTFDLSGPP
jgi:hypothetical protein